MSVLAFLIATIRFFIDQLNLGLNDRDSRLNPVDNVVEAQRDLCNKVDSLEASSTEDVLSAGLRASLRPKPLDVPKLQGSVPQRYGQAEGYDFLIGRASHN